MRAEISRVDERGGFMGGGFGPLASSSGTETAQGRFVLGGKIAKDWEGFAEYEQARLSARTGGGGYLQGMDGARADGWAAGLQRRNVFLGGDRLRYSVRQKTGLSGGVARFSAPVAEGDARAAFMTGSGQTLVVNESGVDLGASPQIVHGLGYAFYPWNGAEMSFGGEYESKTKTGALSAALRIDF